MSNPDGFDVGLAARFENEHRQVPEDAFVAVTMRTIRRHRKRRTAIRVGLRVAALAAAVALSPWLIAGAARLNAALELSFNWTTGVPGAWIVGALALVVMLVTRARRR